ncbi:putative polygalacturonase [Bienertia sinuspersici]
MLPIILLLLTAISAIADDSVTCSGIVPMPKRLDNISITDFGGVGDGKTMNTKAFTKAIYRIQHLRRRGGTLLYIPSGVFLTDSFNLTSHMTLFLANGAVIKATQCTYSRKLGHLRMEIAFLLKNHRVFLACQDETKIYSAKVLQMTAWLKMRFRYDRGNGCGVTEGGSEKEEGENGTIDGQGDVWWNLWRRKTLLYTRPHLIEFMRSKNIIISNVIFKNSPFWTIHPVYSSNVVIRYVTILAPADSPNTDGVDPDSSSNVCVEDSHISNGDDMIAIKSGWDEYGVAYGRPSSDITIRRITGSSPFAGIAIGSEMSGGVENVLAEHINLSNMGVGIHIKTNVGRGGYIRNITISNIYVEKAKKGIRIAGDVGDHPDDKFDHNAIPAVQDITMKSIWGKNIQQPGLVKGIKNAPFTNICLSDINLNGPYKPRTKPWECSNVKGSSLKVSPRPCAELISSHAGSCF